MSKNKKILFMILSTILLIVAVRFILGGSEDTWICDQGQWVEHGHPSAAMPTEPCAI